MSVNIAQKPSVHEPNSFFVPFEWKYQANH